MARKYATEPGGNRARVSDEDKYFVDDEDRVYAFQDGKFKHIGTVPDDGVVKEGKVGPIKGDKSADLTTEKVNSMIRNLEGGTVPKRHSVNKIKASIKNPLDVTNKEGLKALSELKLPDGASLRAKRIIAEAKGLGGFPPKFDWHHTKYEAKERVFQKEIVPLLKINGYDGLIFDDDSHKTYAAFDDRQLQSLKEQDSIKRNPQAKPVKAPETHAETPKPKPAAKLPKRPNSQAGAVDFNPLRGAKDSPAERTAEALRKVRDRLTKSDVRETNAVAKTSVSQVPALFKKVQFAPGTRNIDLGGGRFDKGTEHLAGAGVQSAVLDKFNRPTSHNEKVYDEYAKNPADTATVANVLNVIESADIRREVIEDAGRLVKKGGKIYFDTYEGNKSGAGAKSSTGTWQNNRALKTYLPEVQAVYPDAKIEKGYIVATNEKPAPKATRLPSRPNSQAGAVNIGPAAAGSPAAKAAAGLSAAAKAIKENGVKKELEGIFSPATVDADSWFASLSLRSAMGAQKRGAAVAATALRDAQKYFETMPQAEQRDFKYAMDEGKPQANPQLQDWADLLKDAFANMREELQKRGLLKTKDSDGNPATYYEDYFPRRYKNPHGSPYDPKVHASTRKPFGGTGKALNARSIDTLREAHSRGFEEEHENPITTALAHLSDMNKTILKHDVVQELRGQKLMRFVRDGKPLPDGYAYINDPTMTVKSLRATVKADGSLGVPERILRGKYAAPESVARVLNNYLSTGMEKSKIYRTARAFSNGLMISRLAVSGFHVTMEGVQAAISEAGLGMEKIAHGSAKQKLSGVGNLANATTLVGPTIKGLYNGKRIAREYAKPGSVGGRSADIVNAMTKGGYDGPAYKTFLQIMKEGNERPSDINVYGNNGAANFMRAIKEGNKPSRIVRGAWKAIPAAIDVSSRAVMQAYVPRLKAGVTADLLSWEMEKLGPNATEQQVRAAAAKINDSVDNRFGQLTYDNLFWHKTLKDAMHLGITSVGWNFGSAREGAGAIGDTMRLRQRLAAGDKAMTTRMGYAFGTVYITALMGAISNYIYTGSEPRDAKDLLFPRNGKKNNDGTPQRIELPNYANDVYNIWNDPKGTVQGKLNPAPQSLVELLLDNEDYFGKEIRTPGTVAHQAQEVAGYILKQYEPFSLRGGTIKGKSGGLPAFFGVRQAPDRVIHPGRHYRKVAETPEQYQQRHAAMRHAAMPRKAR